ncbi:hypothetical protein [Pseudorhodoferax sp. Leaf265]|uniref:hypothetical protein n=1 Tax=Pseudorhodoferax sp. Leaf265 TaxID=1736315 RepID=UPI000ADE19CA|nr:hypothetical protein [Pseudorhodoferax sp. Leaf265]
MNDRLWLETFTPVGDRPRGRTVTRRSFIGVSIGVPAAPLLLGTSTSHAATTASRICESTLRFDEDKDGMTVTWYPALETTSQANEGKPIQCVPTFEDERQRKRDKSIAEIEAAQARSWRIVRNAFGPGTKFHLRRDANQPNFIHALEIVGVRFGELATSSHTLTFTHDSKRSHWQVGLSTRQWHAGHPLVSEKQIPFEQLSKPVSSEARTTGIDFTADPVPADLEPEGSFWIDTDADVLRTALRGVLEDHVRVEGPLRLVLAKNGVWSLVPRRKGSTGTLGRILLAQGALLAHQGVSMGWCDPASDESTDSAARTGKRRENDPVFMAWGELQTVAKPVILGDPRHSHITLEAMPILAEPSNPPPPGPLAAPATGKQATTCASDTNPAPFDRTEALDAFKASHRTALSFPPQWRYVRRDWSSRGRHLAGVSTTRAAWLARASLSVSGSISEFGPLCIREGALQQSQSMDPPLRFAGRLNASPWWVRSRIGWFRAQGWSIDAAEIDPANASARTHHPLMTAGCGGFGTSLSSLDVPLLLLESELAPLQCDFSKLSFAPTGLRAVFGSDVRKARADLRASDSYLWLGNESDLGDLPLAHIDLTQARLEVARSLDLARLAFMFAGLHLDIAKGAAWITDTRRSCRVRRRVEPGRDSDPLVLDTRPVLVAEFPPQHVFEEAIFRPSAAPLPDVALKAPTFTVKVQVTQEGSQETKEQERDFSTTLSRLLRQLDELTRPEDRFNVRQAYASMKVEEQAKSTSPAYNPEAPFQKFSKKFTELFGTLVKPGQWPAEQRIYIGALNLPPDLAAEARKLNDGLRKDVTESLLKRTLDDADRLVELLNKQEPSLNSATRYFWQKVYEYIPALDPANKNTHPLPPLDKARLIEQAVCGVMQSYADYRDFYVEQMVLRQGQKEYLPQDMEFFSSANRKDLKFGPDYPLDDIHKAYLAVLEGTQDPAQVMRARMSGTSRLAFHVDCGSRPGIDVEDGDAHLPSGQSGRTGASNGTRLPFSFEALTDWGHYDLAVTPRARQAAAFDDSGVLIRREISESGLEDDSAGADVTMLKSLGIRSGQVAERRQGPGRSRDWGKSLRTIQERLVDVEASLRVVPDDLQTAIELPARLILSPSQKAQWRTPRRQCPDGGGPVPLWSATLDTDAANPLVRAVASPDMRPEFVRYGLERRLLSAKGKTGEKGQPLHSPVGSAPPRGPRAPWTLGFEESDANISPIEDLFVATSPEGTSPPTNGSVCGQAPSASASASAALPASSVASAVEKPELHQVVEYLCRRQHERAEYQKHAVFRSTLDAYDRHEIVLLSSAWGLPVRGRREKSGELQALRVSSQVELPPEWRLLDAQAGTAIYRPRALKVRELTLTALGGSLRHDSDFVPPSAARHIVHGPLFDSMSVERWQHWTVLGRDVFAEVVYKGYLFPIGHRASLVKQTERVFIRPVGGGLVRAYLRQRMFIRVARPDKTFPAYGQPHGGRKFPGGVVSMLTVTTPDIVDPMEDIQKLDVPSPSGRLFANQAGLVFWPRTARLDGAEVAFDLQVQGAATRAKLLFVDNVAANRAELMDELVAYYNRLPSPDLDQGNKVDIKPVQPLQHFRSLDMRGQSLRYCDEVKPGSASHKTLAWTLKATGCAGVTSHLEKRSTQINPWEGLVERYDDPMLEGADQPPFFPAIETARIRIDQVERLTNGMPQAAIAQFDGWYVKNGFDADRISREKDALEIYLDIVNAVTMDMGGSGDRSGGVMRPAGQVIALSRQRGPLTGTTAAVTSAGTTSSVTGASGYPVTQPEPHRIQRLVGVERSAPSRPDEAKRAFEQFFSSATSALDTRILGLVSLKELVNYLNISNAASDLPVLREAVEYGLGGLDAGAQVMRIQVIVPLHDVVKELEKQWRRAGADALGSLPGFAGEMEDVFPDVDRALKDLLNVLGQTAASTDDAAVFASLAEIYECGRRLMDACGRVAANPLDHLQLAVRQRLQGLGNGIERFSEELGRLQVDALIAPLVANLVSSATVQQLLGGAFDWFAALAGSVEELRKKVKDQEPVLAAFDLSLSWLKSPPPVMDQLRNAIVSAFASKDILPPLQEAARIVGERLDAVQDWLDAARTPLDNLPTPEKPDEATGAVSTALEFFEAARSRVSRARDALTDVAKIDNSEYRQAVHALSNILQIAATIKQIAGDRNAVLALFSQAVSDYLALLVGPRLEKLPSLNDVKSFAQKFLDPIKDAADLRLQSIADPLMPANSKPTPSTNGDFTIPKGWLVPGKVSSLVDRFHGTAKAVQTVLEKAKKATKEEERVDPPSRAALARLGDHALDAEWVLHRAAISVRIAAQAMADLDESKLHSVTSQADAACEALSRLGEDIASTLQRLINDLLALEIDLKIIGPVVTPARDLVERSLRWLADRSTDLKKHLEEISKLHTPWNPVLQPWLDLSGQYGERIKNAADAAKNNSNAQWLKLGNGILPDLSDLPAPANAAKASSAAAVTTLERLAVQQVMAWASSLAVPTQAATNALMAAFRPAVSPVSDAYAKLLEARNQAYTATIGTPAEWFNDALLVRADPALVFVPDTPPDNINAGAKTDSDQLHWDTQSLRHLVALKDSSSGENRSRAVRFLDYLVQGWRTGQSSPLRIARQVRQISLEEVRAKLMALINFSAIREEIEERIKLLIPAAVTLSYDFSTSIRSAAGGSEDKAEVFRPKEGCALSIKTRAKINLLEGGKPSFQSIGEMGAFDIQLLGSFDALTLHFKGVRFVSQGGKPDCDLQYDGFTIGPQLKFLEQLTPFFGSKPGSGFYLKPLDTGIGLEAGYGLNLGTFSVGNLAIFNVSLNAAARLPFDNRGATFVASLSRRDSPFTIAIAPYGGSGFFALEADTKGIVGFEASFEYGGAAAFAYGPLTGQGRLMVGAYIRSSRNSTRIFATFYVGGSASIWVFTFGASLYVNAEQKGSSMEGSATYTFSFSMGIVDYDYKVAVNVNLNLDGSSGGEDQQAAMVDLVDPPVRLASIDPDAWNPRTTMSDAPLHFVSMEPPRKRTTRPRAPAHQPPFRKVDTVCPSSDWGEYSKYFDLGLKVRMEDY